MDVMLPELERSISRNPEKNAFCINNQFYTYGELKARILAIREQLQALPSFRTGCNIALVGIDNIDTYASIFAIWFCGCAYVPLGVQNPVERNLSILQSAGADIIVSCNDLNDDRYGTFAVLRPGGNTSGQSDRQLNQPAGKLTAPDVDSSTLAYILFTSGSTGLPKGVPISHGNVSAFLQAFRKSPFAITEEDHCLQMFELTFDVSVSSYLPPLLAGACVYTVPNDGIKYIQVLKVLQEHKLTSIQIVPSIIKLARPLLKRLNFSHIRNCILTGEATQTDLVPEWRKCIPDAAIFNYYGPTESTIYCSFHPYEDNAPKSYNGMLAIGQAFDGMTLIIVDEDGKLVEPNVKGELLIGGPQLTNGYLNNEEKNQHSFLIRQHEGAEKRFYRSGDLCFLDEAGDIYYCGRLDNQVKVQGFRIELNEIEFLVRNEFGINNIVTLSENKQGAAGLTLVLESPAEEKTGAVIPYLKSKLPEYMVPARMEVLPEFPLNVSGKTDRKRINELVNGNGR